MIQELFLTVRLMPENGYNYRVVAISVKDGVETKLFAVHCDADSLREHFSSLAEMSVACLHKMENEEQARRIAP